MFQYREQEIVRLCMKHFRQRNYSSALQALQLETNVILEDPMLADFHKMLVENGEYEKAEKFLENTMISKWLFLPKIPLPLISVLYNSKDK